MAKRRFIFTQVILYLFGVFSICGCATGSETKPQLKPAVANYSKPDRKQSHIVLISDTHMGMGKQANGEWSKTEDFRWPNALTGFLKHVSDWGKDNVDLIIVGDSLEMWQLPSDIKCEGDGPDRGCTIEESEQIVKRIIAAHADTFKEFTKFSKKGKNRLHIVPGNHDAALVYQQVWRHLAKILDADSGRINIVSNGIWVSDDGKILVEHGHQIGSDTNKYPDWPNIVKTAMGKNYIERPWGEQFVQKLFNEEETRYPIIDNLSPETAGLRYRIADRGFWSSIDDIALFISFNLWETSLRQKLSMLGREDEEKGTIEWDLKKAREQGHKLYAAALPADDSFKKSLLIEDDKSQALRNRLDAMVQDKNELSDNEIKLLCELAANEGNSKVCAPQDLGAIAEKLLVPRKWVLTEHINERRKSNKNMNIFIYGHTHAYEVPWQLLVDKSSGKEVTVVNTGAFQRLVDEDTFKKIVKERNLNEQDALRTIQVEDLPHCYSAVFAHYDNGSPEVKLRMWKQTENGKGKLVSHQNSACYKIKQK